MQGRVCRILGCSRYESHVGAVFFLGVERLLNPDNKGDQPNNSVIRI